MGDFVVLRDERLPASQIDRHAPYTHEHTRDRHLRAEDT